MDPSEETTAPGEEACGSAGSPSKIGKKTPTNTPPLTPRLQAKLAEPKSPGNTSFEKDLQKTKGKKTSKSRIPQAIRSFPIDINSPKKSAEIKTTSKRAAPSTSKAAEPVAEPKREPRAMLSARSGRLTTMDPSEEIIATGGEACGSADNPDGMDEKTPTNTPRRQPQPKCAVTTSSEKDLQKPNCKKTSNSKIPQANRSLPIDTKGPRTSAKVVSKIGATAGPAAKGNAGIQNKKPFKNIKVTNNAPSTSKSAQPVAEPNPKPLAMLSARSARKPAPMAQDADKKTTGLSRGKTIAGISCSTSLASKMSLSGDASARQSARERVSDSNKLKVFEGQLMKLEAVQTDFLRKFETMKASMQEKCPREFKFIGMVQGGNCKLVVQEDYLKKIPLKLPSHAIADLKKETQDFLNACLIAVQEEAKNKGLDVATLEDRLEQEQARRLSSFFGKMNDLCALPEASEQDLAKLKKQLLDTKRLADDYQQQINQQKRAHTLELATRENASRKELELQISKKDGAIAESKRKIRALLKEQERLMESAQCATTVQTMDQGEREKLVQEIKSLKDTQLTLTKKLRQNEVAHKRTVGDLKERDTAIAALEKELDDRKKFFESVRSRNKAEVSQQLLEKSKEVSQLKESLEQNLKDFEALEENLSAARKELEEAQDFKLQVNRYKAYIKKLKQDLMEKEKELLDRPPNPEQYPAKMSSLLKTNKKLTAQLEEVSDRAERFRQWNLRLMAEIERITEIDELRREMCESLKESEAEERDRMKQSKKTPEVSIGVQKKEQELQALCSSLGSTQVELTRQGHMIQLMKDRHERSELVRVKQQQAISRLQEELIALKLAKLPLKKDSEVEDDDDEM